MWGSSPSGLFLRVLENLAVKSQESKDLILKLKDECKIAVNDPFDLVTRMIKDDDKKNSFPSEEKSYYICASS